MNYDKVCEQFGDWAPMMRNLIESEIFDNLYIFLKSEKSKGKTIIPASGDVWKSLKLCSRHKVRAIILLQCPYATKRGDIIIASGVPMSCENIAPYQQPSLYQWHQAIESQYGFDPDNDLRCDISYLLREEGVLLMNTAGTVELNKVDSHQSQWFPITRWFIENVINKYLNGIPVVLIGSQAKKFEQYLNPLANPIKCVEHMAAASYANRDWKHDNLHLWVNSIIEANNGKSETINWLRKKGEQPKEDKQKEMLKEWLGTDDIPEDVPSAKNLGLPWDD